MAISFGIIIPHVQTSPGGFLSPGRLPSSVCHLSVASFLDATWENTRRCRDDPPGLLDPFFPNPKPIISYNILGICPSKWGFVRKPFFFCWRLFLEFPGLSPGEPCKPATHSLPGIRIRHWQSCPATGGKIHYVWQKKTLQK